MNYQKSKNIYKLSLLIALVSILIVIAACKITENSVTKLINQPAPDFNLKDLNGNSVSLSGLLGKTVLINFWETTSPAGVDEMPIFQELYEEWSNRSDVVFLSINLGEGVEKVRRFLELRNFTFPVFMDTDWAAGRFYQIHSTPTTCLVDNQGYLKFSIAGSFKDKAALDKQLNDFIPAGP